MPGAIKELWLNVPPDMVLIVSLGGIMAALPDPCTRDAKILAREAQQNLVGYLTTVEALLFDLYYANDDIQPWNLEFDHNQLLTMFAGALIQGHVQQHEDESFSRRYGWWRIEGQVYRPTGGPGG